MREAGREHSLRRRRRKDEIEFRQQFDHNCERALTQRPPTRATHGLRVREYSNNSYARVRSRARPAADSRSVLAQPPLRTRPLSLLAVQTEDGCVSSNGTAWLMAGVLDLGSAARQACDCLGCDRGANAPFWIKHRLRLMIKQHGSERRYSTAKSAALRAAMSSRFACRFRKRESVMNRACPQFVCKTMRCLPIRSRLLGRRGQACVHCQFNMGDLDSSKFLNLAKG